MSDPFPSDIDFKNNMAKGLASREKTIFEKKSKVAIKYNPWFGDAFYNSSKFGMAVYLLRVFTSWAIVAEVNKFLYKFFSF